VAESPLSQGSDSGLARRGATTRTKLVRAAAEVVAEQGYGAASVAEIARRAGTATGTLYRHFASKGELFAYVFRDAAERQLEAMREAAAAESRYVDKLQAVLERYALDALANRRLSWALVYEPVDAIVDAERLAYRRRYCDQMGGLIQAAVNAGELPPQPASVSAAGVVGALAEALVGPLAPVRANRPEEGDIVDAIIRFCRGALGAR